MNIFHKVFQRQKYCNLEAQQISMVYTEVKTCEFLQEHAMEIINFLKNEIINKIAAGII